MEYQMIFSEKVFGQIIRIKAIISISGPETISYFSYLRFVEC
jgi:hypothetical protein